MSKTRNIGTFTVEKEIYEADIEQLAEVFAIMRFVPTRVDYLYAYDSFLMTGFSKLFRELHLGDKIPEYRLIIDTDTDEQTMEEKVVDVKAELLQ